jgi:hypothetical protein
MKLERILLDTGAPPNAIDKIACTYMGRGSLPDADTTSVFLRPSQLQITLRDGGPDR